MEAFLRAAIARLGLNPAEQDFITANAITSFDALHELLAASPSLAGTLRRAALLEGLLGAGGEMLSPAYRAALARPPAPYIPSGALYQRPPMPQPGGGVGEPGDGPGEAEEPPPADWPRRGKPISLAGERSLDLLGDLAGRWPVRDQGSTPTCVGFAAATALERFHTPAGRVPEPLSALFLYRAMRQAMAKDRSRRPPGAAQGATKLTMAARLLPGSGICPEAAWPDQTPIDRNPGLRAQRAARPMAADCWDLGTLTYRWNGAARAVWNLLADGRPVAVSLPQFRDRDSGPQDPTNWQLPRTLSRGLVPDRLANWVPAPVGHAVCILGFQPVPEERLGGWFVFRNSLGLDFAREAPDAMARKDPRVPEQGYGLISASHIERHVYEIFAPR